MRRSPATPVAADACQHCGTCYYCTHGLYNICERLAFTGLMNNGAFAEWVNVPANLLYRLPQGFPNRATRSRMWSSLISSSWASSPAPRAGAN